MSSATGCGDLSGPSFEIMIVVGGEREGWTSYESAVSAASETRDRLATRSGDPCMIYFTSGTVAHASVGSSHLCTMTLAFANAPCPSVEPHHAS